MSSKPIRLVSDYSKFVSVNKQYGGDIADVKHLFPESEEKDREKHNNETQRRIRNADILMIKDTVSGVIYLHFGIAYIPKKKQGKVEILVIDMCAGNNGKAIYQQRKLGQVLGDRWLGIFEEEDIAPLSPKVTIERAKSKLSCKTELYNLRTWNCESFARWCKYNDPQSRQAAAAENKLGRSRMERLCVCAPSVHSSGKAEEGITEGEPVIANSDGEEEAADGGS